MSFNSVVDDKTKISLYAVACSLPFVVGTILWLASIDAKATTASHEVASIKELVLEIRDRVIRIEEHVKSRRNEWRK